MKDAFIPSFLIPVDSGSQITLDIPQTDTQVSNPGIIYDQAGVIYNDARYTYGGIFNAGKDIVTMKDTARLEIPHISFTYDQYANIPPVPFAHQSIGPGFFMFITNN